MDHLNHKQQQQLQTPKVKLEPAVALPYPTPEISPNDTKYQKQKFPRHLADQTPDWNVGSSNTPRSVAPDAATTPAVLDGNETESLWEGDSSFEVSANLITEINQKYGDDYLNSTEYQSLSPSYSKASQLHEHKPLETIYPAEVSWNHAGNFEPDEKEPMMDDEDDDFEPEPPAPSKAAKRRVTHPPAKRKAIRIKKNQTSASKTGVRRWTESDDDKVAFLREYGNLKWHEVTEFINGRHTPQAVQMRYLRSLKRRNDNLTSAEQAKLRRLVEEDYEARFKRISTHMGPSFTPVRIQKIFLEDAGLNEMLQVEKVWTKEEIAKFVDEAAGDFDSFVVPYRADKLPPRAAAHMEQHMNHTYKDLIQLYVGANAYHDA